MYLGYLLPTIEVLKEKLRDLKPKLNLCGPLADALIRGLEKRFDRLLNDDFHLLATISHPKFKDMDLFDDPGTSVKAKELFIRELSKVIPKENEENEDTENVNDSKDECDGFFSRRRTGTRASASTNWSTSGRNKRRT